MKKSTVKNMFKLVPDMKKRYFQEVPEVRKAEAPTAEGISGPIASVPSRYTSMFPDLSVLYKDELRDFILTTDYDATLIRPLPIFYIAIGYKGGDDGENAIMPVVLHHGYDKTAPMYGYVEGLSRNTNATILNAAYDPEATFQTTVLDIGAHITREFCRFKFSVPSVEDKSKSELLAFKWKQCNHDPEVIALARERALPGHDWSWIDRKNERGMKLFKEDTGEVLAVYVAGKSHSKMNPMKVIAKIKWLESETWTEQLKLAAFLAWLCYAEKTRRVGTGGGGMILI